MFLHVNTLWYTWVISSCYWRDGISKLNNHSSVLPILISSIYFQFKIFIDDSENCKTTMFDDYPLFKKFKSHSTFIYLLKFGFSWFCRYWVYFIFLQNTNYQRLLIPTGQAQTKGVYFVVGSLARDCSMYGHQKELKMNQTLVL